MKNAKLQAYKISKIDFKNEVTGTVQLKFQSKVAHHVRYSRGNSCEAVLELEVSDPKNPKSISLTLEVSGVYRVNPEATKEEVHLETLRELFTYAKAFTTAITGVAGIKPIIINDIDFENQDIIRYNLGDIKRQLGNDTEQGVDDTVDGPDGSDI